MIRHSFVVVQLTLAQVMVRASGGCRNTSKGIKELEFPVYS
jgi:hypothetical protein